MPEIHRARRLAVVAAEGDEDEAMERTCERLFAEAGYPDARVAFEWTGIFVDGVPQEVMQRAFDLVDAVDR